MHPARIFLASEVKLDGCVLVLNGTAHRPTVICCATKDDLDGASQAPAIHAHINIRRPMIRHASVAVKNTEGNPPGGQLRKDRGEQARWGAPLAIRQTCILKAAFAYRHIALRSMRRHPFDALENEVQQLLPASER